MGLLELEELQAATSLFRGKVGTSFAKSLMRGLSVDKLNNLYDSNAHMGGTDFTQGILHDIDVEYNVQFGNEVVSAEEAKKRMADILPDGPFITISNHPYGSIDGVMVIDLVASARPDYKVMVNKILARIKALDNNFITVTPKTQKDNTPTSASVLGMKLSLQQLRNGGGLGLFPSGAVSDLSLIDRCVRDRAWQLPIIKLIKKAKVPVLPIRFFDGNSKFYYSLGLIYWQIRLLKLPSEVFNKSSQIQRIGVGDLISVDQIQACDSLESLRDMLRASVYDQTSIQDKQSIKR